jgi:acyl-CoA synthetase (AMP-forming)/AMP-acid ligase II
VDASILVRAATIWGLVERRAELSGAETALLDEGDTRLTFGEFRDRAEQVAAALHAGGIGPGSRVAWQLFTKVETYVLMAALARLGAVQAPIIPLYRERELAAAVIEAEAEVLVVPGTWRGTDYAAMARSLDLGGRTAPRLLVLENHGPLPASDEVAALPAPPADSDEVRWVYFTSGSTGLPKGVRHSDRSLLEAAYGFALHGGLGSRPGDIGSVPYPVAHIGGVQYLICMLAVGFPVVMIEHFPSQGLETLRRHRVTMTGGSTVFYTALLTAQRAQPDVPLLPALRLLKGGGAPCPSWMYQAILAEMGVTLAHDYGMTEVPMVCVALPDDTPEALAETEGKPIPGLRLRIMDGDRSVADGTEGEIQVSGPMVFHGYTDPEATAAAFTADGWFRTGDWGRRHPGGHIEVTGRIKDVIIRKGENIAPLEIEELLTAHPAVNAAAVIGLPDAGRGELVCAVISPEATSVPPTLAELKEHLMKAGLMVQKLPERLEILEVLPVTGLGKIAKAELRKRYA